MARFTARQRGVDVKTGPQYAVTYTLADDDPREWARRREGQGWNCLAVTDHLVTDYRPPFPHLWVSAGAIAAVTSSATIATTFVNGVFRHPADTAQAARQLQQVSDGRFELGVGAGWFEAEMVSIGWPWPKPGDRAGAFVEAVQVLRPLLAGESCQFDGQYYSIDLPAVGPATVATPPLIASVGGPRTIREVTPHVDRVEVKPAAAATRGGTLDWANYATVTSADVDDLLARVRLVRDDIPVDMFVICNAAEDRATKERAEQLGDGFAAQFFGSPSAVAESIMGLAERGVGRITLSALDPESIDRLAPLLVG
jgi:alkanesulfonate monooxygenase SsuD/methylene tetrahydromethanopterin reductase-like flavin-dependent oxidoreductase (luciferase family)